jgi:hypothetical protein
MGAQNPFQGEDGKWYWYDETNELSEPYDTEKDARADLDRHNCRLIHGPDPRSFEGVAQINRARSAAWHGDGAPWSTADWGNATAGESGELYESIVDAMLIAAETNKKVGKLADKIKKLRRVETGVAQSKEPLSMERAEKNVMDEVADVYLYLDLLCEHLGVSLYDCVKGKFNDVSEKMGFPHRLP